jgi:hypothetical protein
LLAHPEFKIIILRIFMLCTPHQISLGDQVNKTEIGTACSTYEKRRCAYRALVEKPEGRRPLGSPRRRWQDNIEMDLREVGLGTLT